MVRLYGTVNSKIIWQKEVEDGQPPVNGSVRLLISSIAWGNYNFSVDYKLDTEYKAHITYIDISYSLANLTSKVKRLEEGDKVLLEMFKQTIYKREGHFTVIQEVEGGGQKLFNYLKCKERDHNITRVTWLNDLSPLEVSKRVISTSELITKLIGTEERTLLPTLQLPRPILKKASISESVESLV